jgi:hypothetical protein
VQVEDVLQQVFEQRFLLSSRKSGEAVGVDDQGRCGIGNRNRNRPVAARQATSKLQQELAVKWFPFQQPDDGVLQRSFRRHPG